MARVLVLTDREAADPDWKGEQTWQIIRSLAESQHEVLVATPLASELIPITHPRLTVAQAVRSWRADQMTKLAPLLLTFQPQVIQTFALKRSSLWPSLSVWPYLQGLSKVIPHMRRVSTLFEESDCTCSDAAFGWHQAAHVVTAFSERQRTRLELRLSRSVQLVPIDTESAVAGRSKDEDVLVPAPVSEWNYPDVGLERLAAFSEAHPQAQVHILGGWGEWTALARKRGWLQLEKVAGRIHMTDPVSGGDFAARLYEASALWLEPLRQDSWRYLLATQLGQRLEKEMFLSHHWTPAVELGSTANSLSRLYLE